MNTNKDVLESIRATLDTALHSNEYTAEDCETIYGIGVSLMHSGDPAKAEKLFQLLVLRRPFFSEYWHGYGECLQELKKFSQATTAYNMSILSKPTFNGYVKCAECYLSMGNYSEAQSHITNAQEHASTKEEHTIVSSLLYAIELHQNSIQKDQSHQRYL